MEPIYKWITIYLMALLPAFLLSSAERMQGWNVTLQCSNAIEFWVSPRLACDTVMYFLAM